MYLENLKGKGCKKRKWEKNNCDAKRNFFWVVGRSSKNTKKKKINNESRNWRKAYPEICATNFFDFPHRRVFNMKNCAFFIHVQHKRFFLCLYDDVYSANVITQIVLFFFFLSTFSPEKICWWNENVKTAQLIQATKKYAEGIDVKNLWKSSMLAFNSLIVTVVKIVSAV